MFHDPVLSFTVRSGYPMDLGCNIDRSKVDVKVAKFKLFSLVGLKKKQDASVVKVTKQSLDYEARFYIVLLEQH